MEIEANMLPTTPAPETLEVAWVGALLGASTVPQPTVLVCCSEYQQLLPYTRVRYFY
jgi:hypothetical protein